MSRTCPARWWRAAPAWWLAGALTGAGSAAAQPVALCTGHGSAATRALFERFIHADCAGCWSARTATAPRRAATLDWVVPGAQADDAPLAAVARRDALQRPFKLPTRLDPQRSVLSKLKPGAAHHLGVAHGLRLNGYMGASLRFTARGAVAAPLTGWLALVEQLPAGTEDSPVPRALVRNLLSEPVAPEPTGNNAQLWRPMNVPQGADPQRLAVVGWVSDARGRLIAIAQADCRAKP